MFHSPSYYWVEEWFSKELWILWNIWEQLISSWQTSIFHCSWCRCKCGSISGLFSYILSTTISHDKFDCSLYGTGYKSTGGKFMDFFKLWGFLIPFLKWHLVYWSTKHFLFCYCSSFRKCAFHCCSTVAPDSWVLCVMRLVNIKALSLC